MLAIVKGMGMIDDFRLLAAALFSESQEARRLRRDCSSSLLFARMAVSSAYRIALTMWCSVGESKKHMSFIKIRNSSGERGSPWGVPISMLKSSPSKDPLHFLSIVEM